jgi:type VI secretion system ImpA family protein
MALDLESLLAPLDEEDPAGPDLAYDSDRYEIEQAFERPTASGAEDEAAVENDVSWGAIRRLILDQAEKTRDIWLPVYLCRAGALSGDLETVEDGAQYLAGLLESLWGDMHPKLDEYGFQGRKGPCESLTAYATFLAPMRRIVLLQHPRLGSYSGADFDRFRQKAEEEDGYGMFRAALEDSGVEALKEIAARLDRIESGFRRADTVLTDNAEGDTSTNFQPTYALLSELKRSLSAFIPADEAADGDDADEDIGDSFSGASASPARRRKAAAAAPVQAAGAPYTGEPLKDREDVMGAFDALADYYQRIEPGSPVVLLLKRARQWVGLDFLSVLDDIAPSGLGDARQLLISRAERGDGGGSSSSSSSSFSSDDDSSSDTSFGDDDSSSSSSDDDDSSSFSFDSSDSDDSSSGW